MHTSHSGIEADEALDSTTEDSDYFLRALIGMANQGMVTLPVTLVTHGFLVSGTLIGGKDYYEGFAADMLAGFDNHEIGEAFCSAIAEMGTQIYSPSGEGQEDAPLPIGFVHLRDARFFHPGGTPVPGNRGVFWRGRLSEVAGFCMGTLSPS